MDTSADGVGPKLFRCSKPVGEAAAIGSRVSVAACWDVSSLAAAAFARCVQCGNANSMLLHLFWCEQTPVTFGLRSSLHWISTIVSQGPSSTACGLLQDRNCVDAVACVGGARHFGSADMQRRVDRSCSCHLTLCVDLAVR